LATAPSADFRGPYGWRNGLPQARTGLHL